MLAEGTNNEARGTHHPVAPSGVPAPSPPFALSYDEAALAAEKAAAGEGGGVSRPGVAGDDHHSPRNVGSPFH